MVVFGSGCKAMEQPRTASTEDIDAGLVCPAGEIPSSMLFPVGQPPEQGTGIPGSSPLSPQFRLRFPGPGAPFYASGFWMGLNMAATMPAAPNMVLAMLATTNMASHMPPRPSMIPPHTSQPRHALPQALLLWPRWSPEAPACPREGSPWPWSEWDGQRSRDPGSSRTHGLPWQREASFLFFPLLAAGAATQGEVETQSVEEGGMSTVCLAPHWVSPRHHRRPRGTGCTLGERQLIPQLGGSDREGVQQAPPPCTTPRALA